MKYLLKFHLRHLFLFSFILFLLTNCKSLKAQVKTTDKLKEDEIGMLIKKNSPLNGAKMHNGHLVYILRILPKDAM